MYIQIPVSAFYFVLGLICGAVGLICILNIVAKKEQQKQIDKYKQMFDKLNDNDK